MVKRTNVVLVVVCALGTVLVQPALAGDHSQKGEWELAVLEWPLQAIHMVLMKNGKVLCLYVQAAEKNIIAVDPSTDPPTVTEPQTQPEDFFCSGHSQLGDPNGKILFAGGGLDPEGHHFAHTFDPVELDLGQNPWEVMEDIVTPGDTRFYPTATTLGNGLVLLTAGRDSTSSDDPADEDFPALFNLNPPASDPQWTRMDESAEKVIHWYSFMFQLTDGNVFMGGGSFFLKDENDPDLDIHLDTYKLDVGLEQWTLVAQASKPGVSAVMYRPDKIMKAGNGHYLDPANTVQVINFATAIPPPAWTEVEPMTHARKHFYLIPMPDGRVLAVGGHDATGSVLEAEWYDPNDDNWDVLAPMDMDEPRRRHSSALLLPDARVLVAGGQSPDERQLTAQIFKPPYLFKLDDTPVGGDRPTISSAPTAVVYNTNFSVGTPDVDDITKISLIRVGAATHSFDQNTRFLPLSFTKNAFTLSVAAPAGGNNAPPGYYMLFILKDGDRPGIKCPSEARIIRLKEAMSP